VAGADALVAVRSRTGRLCRVLQCRLEIPRVAVLIECQAHHAPELPGGRLEIQCVKVRVAARIGGCCALEAARDPERRTKSQKADWFAVVDIFLQTVRQNGTKLTRGAFPVFYRLAASKDKKRMKTVLLLKLVSDDVDCPDNENRVHGRRHSSLRFTALWMAFVLHCC
jgi:hypothetical protein